MSCGVERVKIVFFSYFELRMASAVGSTLSSYLEGQWIESSSGFVSETCLPWWGIGVTRLTSAREAKQHVGGLKPVNFNFKFFIPFLNSVALCVLVILWEEC